MIATMDNAGGIGLAAPQVGVLQRVITLHMPEEQPFAMVNPRIMQRQGEREVSEGCLSVPGYTGMITRAKTVQARALDLAGGRLKLTAEELLAQAIEHEIDHLNGIIFLDHLRNHEELAKTGLSPSDPHWHDVGYTVYSVEQRGLQKDQHLVEVLQATARLSEITHTTSLSETKYDLTSGEEPTDYPTSKTETSGSNTTL